MVPPYCTILLLLIAVPLEPRASEGRVSAAMGSVTVPLTKTLRFPVQEIGSKRVGGDGRSSPALGIWPGAEDELPEGPASFDVLSDGSIAIADPLLQRIVLYDAAGKYSRTVSLDFPVDSITAQGGQLWVLRDEKTGGLHGVDSAGKAHPGISLDAPALPKATVERGANRATVTPLSSAGKGAYPVMISYDRPGSSLIAVEPIASAGEQGVFVALEVTNPESTADSIDVHKLVRRYTTHGVLVAESTSLPADYFVPPVDELRVRNGVLYQLATSRTEVRINEWDTNAK